MVSRSLTFPKLYTYIQISSHLRSNLLCISISIQGIMHTKLVNFFGEKRNHVYAIVLYVRKHFAAAVGLVLGLVH